MRRWTWRVIGYGLVVAGVVFGFSMLIPLSARRESGNWTWGWPETVVTGVAISVVCLGLVVLGSKRFGGRSDSG